MDHDNTANLHQIMVHPDCLYGSKVIETLLQKPGMYVHSYVSISLQY